MLLGSRNWFAGFHGPPSCSAAGAAHIATDAKRLFGMNTLALKLTVTPLLILAASLASRRWGESVGGWFVGLPLTSGPVCFFLALDQGSQFAAASCLGSLAGVVAEGAFCLGYGFAARSLGWAAAILTGTAGFVLAATIVQLAGLPLWPLAVAAGATLALALRLLPRPSRADGESLTMPAWDIPARMVVATALVLGLTALAPHAGARLSGLLATYPVFAAVLTVFSHHGRGAAAAIQVLRGLMTGLFAFIGFFVVLATSLPGLGIAAGFAIATLLALAIQAASLQLLRRA